MENPASHFDPVLGDPFADPDTEPCLRHDPEAESVRSHPSSHADQALLPHPVPPVPSRSQTQRLQRRRNQYYYVNGVLVPAASPQPLIHQSSRLGAHHAPASPSRPGATQTLPHKRAKSHGPSGTTSSWALGGGGGGGGGAFADAKRQSWTGERREMKKLQKDHPVGSARPNYTLAIGNGDEQLGAAPDIMVERDGAKGSVLGVRRKMERLKGLYRRGSKEVVMPSSLH